MQRSATDVFRVQIEKLHPSQAHAWCRLAYQMEERVLSVIVGHYNSTLGSSTWARASGGAHVRHRMVRRFPRGLDSTSYELAGAVTWLIHRVLRRLNGASLQTRQQPSKVGSGLGPAELSNPEILLPKLSGNFGRDHIEIYTLVCSRDNCNSSLSHFLPLRSQHEMTRGLCGVRLLRYHIWL